MLAIIAVVLFLSFDITLSFVANTSAQIEEPWKTYTSEECKVSFQYPASWIVKTKQGTFDTNTTYLVTVYNPAVNLTDANPD